MTLRPPRHHATAPTPPENGAGAVRLLATLSFVLAAHAAALGLYYGLGVHQLTAIFLLPVLAAAIAFGAWYGFIAALAAVTAHSYLIDPSHALWRFDAKQDLLNLALFVGAAWAAGGWSEALRRRQRAARALLEAGGGLSAAADGRALGSFFTPVAEPRTEAWPPRLAIEARRAAGSAAITAACGVVAVVAGPRYGEGLETACLLVAVVLAGGLFGVRFGVLTAIVAGVLHAAIDGHVRSDPVGSLLAIALFCALGGWIGALADRRRDEQQALRALLRTGPSLAVAAEEAALRQTLFDAVTTALRAPPVRIADETGKITHDRLTGPQPPQILLDDLPVNETVGFGLWRIRRMTVEGRDLGVVTWKVRAGRAAGDSSIDEVVAAIVDLGASAIARSRLTVEKAEMEFVARTEQLRTILLDAVSHQFRTPLTSILGSATSLLDQDEHHTPRARRDFMLIIKEQANRLNRYVENFLAVARLESGEIEIRPQDVELEPFLYDVWESFGEAGGAKRFFDVEMQDLTVRADPAPLKQVLGNVLENAIKFSAEGSVIRVRGGFEAGRSVLEVSDEGPGVTEGDLTRIFERFFRSARAKAPGLGLGLYITKSLVELMGGAIEARRREDQHGLTIRICLPLAKEAA